jgi:hypothetical protein
VAGHAEPVPHAQAYIATPDSRSDAQAAVSRRLGRGPAGPERPGTMRHTGRSTRPARCRAPHAHAVPRSSVPTQFAPGDPGGGEPARRPSRLASSCADGADTSPPRASAHHCNVDRPNHAGTPPKRPARPASPSPITASNGSRPNPGAAVPESSQRISAHTSRPPGPPHTPVRADNSATTTKPRPCSPAGSAAIRGPVGAPPSATATRTTGPDQATSTANRPPRPLAVCTIALLASSLATLITSSRAGHSGSSHLSHCRSALSSCSCPAKTRRHRSCDSGDHALLTAPAPSRAAL